VVEGVGGFRVPLTATQDTADLAVALKLPVVLVVGMRLGCISHALLTAEAIATRGLMLAGWVANRVDPAMTFPDENIASIREHLAREYDAPLLGIVPHLSPASPELAADRLDINRLLQTLRHQARGENPITPIQGDYRHDQTEPAPDACRYGRYQPERQPRRRRRQTD